jgi:hypothetical protein
MLQHTFDLTRRRLSADSRKANGYVRHQHDCEGIGPRCGVRPAKKWVHSVAHRRSSPNHPASRPSIISDSPKRSRTSDVHGHNRIEQTASCPDEPASRSRAGVQFARAAGGPIPGALHPVRMCRRRSVRPRKRLVGPVWQSNLTQSVRFSETRQPRRRLGTNPVFKPAHSGYSWRVVQSYSDSPARD